MKAVILAGGKGTRLLPLTEDIPKVLVKVEGKPFLYYLLKSLQQAGYSEFGIVVNYKKEKIVDFLDEYGFTATLIHQGEALGTGHAVLQAKSFVDGENFMCTNGDDFRSVDDFKALSIDDDYNYVLGVEVNDPENYGVFVVGNENFLERVVEKPQERLGRLVNSGIYKFTPEIFDELKAIEKSTRGEYELTDAITALAAKRKVKVLLAQGFWESLSTLEDIPHIEAVVKELDLS